MRTSPIILYIHVNEFLAFSSILLYTQHSSHSSFDLKSAFISAAFVARKQSSDCSRSQFKSAFISQQHYLTITLLSQRHSSWTVLLSQQRSYPNSIPFKAAFFLQLYSSTTALIWYNGKKKWQNSFYSFIPPPALFSYKSIPFTVVFISIQY